MNAVYESLSMRGSLFADLLLLLLVGAEVAVAQQLCAGFEHGFALTASGEIKGWGNANAVSPLSGVSYRVASLKQVSCKGTSEGGLSCAVSANGEALCWGVNSPTVDRNPAQAFFWAQISVGALHICGISASGEGHCFGDSNDRKLEVPQINISQHEERWSQMSAGGGHSCGVTTRGRAHCWGANHYGQVRTWELLTIFLFSPH